MNYPELPIPTPEILGISATERNSRILDVLFKQINTDVTNDLPDGVLKIVRIIQKQKMLPLSIVDLWNPKIPSIMQELGISDQNGAIRSRLFNYEQGDQQLVITGIDNFLFKNCQQLEMGSEVSRIFQMCKIASKYCQSMLVTFQDDDYEKFQHQAYKNYWMREFLLERTVMDVIH